MTTPQPYPGMPSQPAPQGVPYPPQPPAKKKHKWPAIVGGVVALMIVGSIFNDDKKDTKPAESTTTVAQSPAAAPAETKQAEPAATLNTPVRDGKFEFVVRSVQSGLADVGDNPYLNQKAQGQFVIVTLTVQNIGDRPQGFSPSNQKLIDTEGRSFETDTSAQIALDDNDIAVWDNINPGNTVDVSLVYDMPVGSVPASIELHDSMFSGGATVNLTP
ncbi:DUF4352 domain-containing protein [Mycolicibacterium goodii]|uniref:DUF4352 domain-containing protein n=1 Tax=Mycolicibacterium goodii TaxID=134601 RepID=A0ABS6HYT6_MYCGD|nr:DUF4352 domain-containing protein [Mycolicibacterium goodii]MBU8827080.1 DUF4352 domain-containing protein [Mycolicibacterium goodii]MBU8840792.1 DUF4352 domain-containing protein [Mycolicibacterium goodii]